jgi:hypothetical protein
VADGRYRRRCRDPSATPLLTTEKLGSTPPRPRPALSLSMRGRSPWFVVRTSAPQLAHKSGALRPVENRVGAGDHWPEVAASDTGCPSALASHARGRWFETSRSHGSGKPVLTRLRQLSQSNFRHPSPSFARGRSARGAGRGRCAIRPDQRHGAPPAPPRAAAPSRCDGRASCPRSARRREGGRRREAADRRSPTTTLRAPLRDEGRRRAVRPASRRRAGRDRGSAPGSAPPPPGSRSVPGGSGG